MPTHVAGVVEGGRGAAGRARAACHEFGDLIQRLGRRPRGADRTDAIRRAESKEDGRRVGYRTRSDFLFLGVHGRNCSEEGEWRNTPPASARVPVLSPFRSFRKRRSRCCLWGLRIFSKCQKFSMARNGHRCNQQAQSAGAMSRRNQGNQGLPTSITSAPSHGVDVPSPASSSDFGVELFTRPGGRSYSPQPPRASLRPPKSSSVGLA